MIEVLFIGLILIYGLIHLRSFVKVFNLADLRKFNSSTNKFQGVLWLACSVFLILTAILLILKFDWWWATAIFSIILSQILIIKIGKYKKAGTGINIIILLVAIMGFSLWNFNLQVNQERKTILSENIMKEQMITEDLIKDLPIPVKRWLGYSGIIGRKQIDTVYLRQKGFMKLKPDQKDWMEAEAEQYFTINQPSFIWNVRTSMMGIPVVGRDLFKDGQGSMQIKLAGLLPVVNVADNSKINESTIQRYLGEIIWFPSAALSDYIKWKPIDNYSARATMSYGGSTGSAVFHFDSTGKLTKFVALRYRDIEDINPTEWVATVKKHENTSGINIPTKLEISWNLEDGTFTWYKFEIYDVLYNDILL